MPRQVDLQLNLQPHKFHATLKQAPPHQFADNDHHRTARGQGLSHPMAILHNRQLGEEHGCGFRKQGHTNLKEILYPIEVNTLDLRWEPRTSHGRPDAKIKRHRSNEKLQISCLLHGGFSLELLSGQELRSFRVVQLRHGGLWNTRSR